MMPLRDGMGTQLRSLATEGGLRMEWQTRLRAAVEQSAWTLAEIEATARVSRGAVRHLLRTDEKAPKTGPGIRTAQAIADALGVSAGWLWFGEA